MSSRGVVDIVILIDVTGSMQPCIDAVKNSVNMFFEVLTAADANSSAAVRDWRARVVGYRDHGHDGSKWIEWNPFVATTDEVRRQLDGLHAEGGGDEPESLLDALYLVVNQEETGPQDGPDPQKWRARRGSHRVVIVFTDASYHQTMTIPEASGGTYDDVKNIVHSKRVILLLFTPEMPCFEPLAELDKSEWHAVPIKSGESPAGALQRVAKDKSEFDQVLSALAKSVSTSASIDPL